MHQYLQTLLCEIWDILVTSFVLLLNVFMSYDCHCILLEECPLSDIPFVVLDSSIEWNINWKCDILLLLFSKQIYISFLNVDVEMSSSHDNTVPGVTLHGVYYTIMYKCSWDSMATPSVNSGWPYNEIWFPLLQWQMFLSSQPQINAENIWPWTRSQLLAVNTVECDAWNWAVKSMQLLMQRFNVSLYGKVGIFDPIHHSFGDFFYIW